MSAHTVTTASNSDRNVIVIKGSPRASGNTAKLLEAFLSSLPKDINIKIFDAYSINPLGCSDCGYCKENDCCFYHDLDEFFKAYEEADFVVIASPIYNYSFPAPLKAIIDRFQIYYNKRFFKNIKPPIKKQKKAFLLLTCGSDSKEGESVITKQLSRIFSVLNTQLTSKYTVDNLDKTKITDKNIEDIKNIANTFLN